MSSWELEDDRMKYSQVDDDEDDEGPYLDHLRHHQEYAHVHGLSRLATCTTSNSTLDCDNFEVEDDDNGLKTMLSSLPIDNIDLGGDADEETSDGQQEGSPPGCLSSDDENDKRTESGTCYSLPGTPLQHGSDHNPFRHFIKQYASENETRKGRRNERRRRWKRRALRRENMKVDDEENSIAKKMERSSGWSHGESESGRGGLRVITRTTGGEHSLAMDMEEVKACRDLGFDLELDGKMMPNRLTVSASTLDTTGATTSSGGSSPIANWRISSPGDDSRDVKARLKVWAQAVALASTSPRSGS